MPGGSGDGSRHNRKILAMDIKLPSYVTLAVLLAASAPALAQDATAPAAPAASSSDAAPATKPQAGEAAAPASTNNASGANEATAPAATNDGAAAGAAGTSSAAPGAQQASSPQSTAAAKAAAESLSPLVQDVQIVGPWSQGDEQGVWRAVMIQSPGGDTKFHFFVQQLGGSGTDMTLKASTEITEINTIDGAIVGYRADEPSEDEPSGLTLFFDVLPTNGEVAETYELQFFPNGPYVFGPASN